MTEFDPRWKPLIDHLTERRDRIYEALAAYKDRPRNIREMMANHGVEVTPDELKEFADLIQRLLEATDE